MQQLITGRKRLNAENLQGMMARLGMARPLLVGSRRMQADFLRRTGLEFPLFDGFHPNPDLDDCIAGAEMFRTLACDGLIAVGGGSAMDTAKGIKALLLAGNMEAVKASRLPEGVCLPLIAIPGTAGTGSEATPFAVVYVEGQKLSLDHPALLPEAVLLDASLLDTLPEYHKKACALDALCQGIESFWAVQATAESRIHAERAIRGVLENIEAYLAGDAGAAEAVLLAAWESGRAIRISRTTAAHAMSYQITKRIGPAHGHACMLTLPYLWRRMAGAPILEELAGVMGVSAQAGPELLLGLLAALDMLPKACPDDGALDALTASVNVQRLGNHPQAMREADLREVYVQALTPPSQAERADYLARWREYHG